jgi:hypothetical protein
MKNLFQNRWLRALAWTAVSLVTLYALLCAWMNWTGARMLSEALARLKAEGETTDFRAVTREPVPDAQNFCAIPALKDLSLQVDGDSEKGEPGARRKRLEALKFPSGDQAKDKPKLGRGAMFGEQVNLEAWRDWLRKAGLAKGTANAGNAGRDVLDALSVNDALVSELASGLNRSAAQWTPAWKTRELPDMLFNIALPHYNATQGLSLYLALRATAAARAGDTTKAHEALQIMAKLNEANMDDPFLIGLLVAATGSSIMVNAVWETCGEQCGSAADFAKLESALSATDYRRGALQAWRGELAAAVNAVQFTKTKRDGSMVAMMNGMEKPKSDVIALLIDRLLPAGFFDGNSAVIVERELDHMIKPMRDQGWVATMEAAEELEAKLREEKRQPYEHPFHLMASTAIPAINAVTLHVAYTQCLVDQASIACALERHRIEYGGYPDSLDGMKLASGKPLPMDALSGKQMGYRKSDNGKYALWCVGFDGKDDGGRRVLKATLPENTRFHDKNYKGDWVWDFPAAK